jgi:hypothetical protein
MRKEYDRTDRFLRALIASLVTFMIIAIFVYLIRSGNARHLVSALLVVLGLSAVVGIWSIWWVIFE